MVSVVAALVASGGGGGVSSDSGSGGFLGSTCSHLEASWALVG